MHPYYSTMLGKSQQVISPKNSYFRELLQKMLGAVAGGREKNAKIL